MICTNCGKEIDDSCNVCPECGTVLNVEAAAAAASAGIQPAAEINTEEPAAGTVYTAPEEEKIERELTKKELRARELEEALDGKNRMGILSTRSIVLSWIVMCIPVIGLFFAIAWACGLCRKAQKRYLGRAFLILTLIALFLFGMCWLVYSLIFRFTLADLPTVINSITTWFVGLLGKVFSRG